METIGDIGSRCIITNETIISKSDEKMKSVIY